MTRKRLILFGAASIAALVGAGLWISAVRRPLSSRVGPGFDALVRGDAGALMAYASEREIREEGLTRDKLQKVLDRLVVPYIDHVTDSEPQTEDDTGDFHALYMKRVATKDGRQVRLGFDLWNGDEGLKTNVLGSVLRNSWYLRFQPSGGYAKPADMFKAGAKGIGEDKGFLSSLGVLGLTPADPTKPFSSWAELESRNRELTARM